MTWECTVRLEPRTKKNSQQIFINQRTGKRFITTSAAYKAYAEAAALFMRGRNKISQPIAVTCIFYMGTHRKVDLTNLLESIDDIMVSCGVIEDDNSNIIVSHDGSRVLYDKENPRTEIFIKTIEKEKEM